jgi:GAF domain-containing protein
VAAEVTEMSGAGIMLVSGTAMQGSLCRTDRVSGILEDLQYDLGEGPCVDAHNLGTPVLEPDLASPATARWTAFSPRAVESGARAVFGFPVRVGAARLGALNLYSDRPGPLSEEQHADALVLADVAARAILTMQAGAEPGELASELEADGNFQFVVHQAAGMVSVQLGISIGEAIVRLRAFAFRTDRLTADVARDVVSRRLRFDDSTEGAGAAPGPGP